MPTRNRHERRTARRVERLDLVVGAWNDIPTTCAYAGLNRSGLYRIMDQLDVRKFGRRTLISRESVERYMNSLPRIGARGHRPMRLALSEAS